MCRARCCRAPQLCAAASHCQCGVGQAAPRGMLHLQPRSLALPAPNPGPADIGGVADFGTLGLLACRTLGACSPLTCSWLCAAPAAAQALWTRSAWSSRGTSATSRRRCPEDAVIATGAGARRSRDDRSGRPACHAIECRLLQGQLASDLPAPPACITHLLCCTFRVCVNLNGCRRQQAHGGAGGTGSWAGGWLPGPLPSCKRGYLWR